MKMKTTGKKKRNSKYKIGDTVIIGENNHLHSREKNIGKIVKVLEQTTFGKVGMYNVAYSYQEKEYEHPFSDYSLIIANRTNLEKHISIYVEILDKFSKELERIKHDET